MQQPTRPSLVAAGCLLPLVLPVGCSQSQGSSPATWTAASAPSPSSSTPPTKATPATSPTTSAPSPSPASPASSTSAVRANRPQSLTLGAGETAHLTYFDVTVQRSTAGRDGISRGWRVQVCYTHPHAGQNADGTTRVSKDPWSIQVRDGEGGGPYQWVAVSEFPADPSWPPLFRQSLLRVGQCETGWIAIRHGNPDLLFGSIRYRPANFGDSVTWNA